jgi:hypothetical protein
VNYRRIIKAALGFPRVLVRAITKPSDFEQFNAIDNFGINNLLDVEGSGKILHIAFLEEIRRKVTFELFTDTIVQCTLKMMTIDLYLIKFHSYLYPERAIRVDSGPKLPSPVAGLLIKTIN